MGLGKVRSEVRESRMIPHSDSHRKRISESIKRLWNAGKYKDAHKKLAVVNKQRHKERMERQYQEDLLRFRKELEDYGCTKKYDKRPG